MWWTKQWFNACLKAKSGVPPQITDSSKCKYWRSYHCMPQRELPVALPRQPMSLCEEYDGDERACNSHIPRIKDGMPRRKKRIVDFAVVVCPPIEIEPCYEPHTAGYEHPRHCMSVE
jgi:hypothetical protein